jgi:hypothetical protein
MNCREVRYYLNDYADGHLIDEIRSEIENHLNICYDCKCEYNNLNLILNEARSLPKTIEPSKDLWEGINKKISGKKGKRSPKIFPLRSDDSHPLTLDTGSLRFNKPGKNKGRFLAVSSAAAAVILGVVLGIIYYYNQVPAVFMPVEKLAGIPVIGSEQIEEQGMLRIGDWLRTDESSSARLKVGNIGEVDVHPNSNIKLVQTIPSEYRLMLDHGKINASIWAPPRLFFVETPSATAIDLGCMYTLEVDEEGSGLLKVTSGWVALKSNERESLIPADAICKTKKDFSPGTPYFTDASEEFIEALDKLDFGNSGSESLKIILKEARKRDALSLWHILIKVEGADRIITYNRLAELSMPPDDVTLEGIMNGDILMLDNWWETLGYGSKSLWDSW